SCGLPGGVVAATGVDDIACQDKARSNIRLDRVLLRREFTKPACNSVQGRRIPRDDCRASFVGQRCKWAIGKLHQLRFAKPDCGRLVEAGKYFCEGAIVLRPSGSEKLLDSRGVAERCFFRSFSIQVGPSL